MSTYSSEGLALPPLHKQQTKIAPEVFKNIQYSEWTPNTQNIHEKINSQNISNVMIGAEHKQEESREGSLVVECKRIGERIQQESDRIVYEPELQRIIEKVNNEWDQICSEGDSMAVRISNTQSEISSNNFMEKCLKKPYYYRNELLVACSHYSFRPMLVQIPSCQAILIQQKQIRTADIYKIRIWPRTVQPKKFRLQLSYRDQLYVFGVHLTKALYLLPQHFIWFAKIINAKLTNKGFKLQSENINAKQLKQSSIFCEGYIYKRSKYLNQWQERYVVITPEGLFSYKDRKENYSFFIQVNDIQSLSTRFDLFLANLIIRIHCLNQMHYFAIPINDFCLNVSSNWLLSFYRLLMEHKHHIKIIRQ